MAVYKDEQNKTWYVQCWYKDFSGKRKHTTKSGFKTKREAEAWERDFKSCDHSNIMTIGELIAAYKKYLHTKVGLGKLRESTEYGKCNRIDTYILPYFKDTRADKVTTEDINEWLLMLTKTKYVDAKGNEKRLSSGTINITRCDFSQIFEYGISNKGLTRNPVERSEHVAKYSNDTREIWTKEQFMLFRDNIKVPAVRLFFDILFLTGLRTGEASALTPADISPCKLSVVKTCTYAGKKKLIGPPKTDSSKRDVVISEGLYNAIMDYIRTVPNLKPTDRIFPYTQTNYRHHLSGLIKKLGLPHTSQHCLRHAYASYLYEAGKDITVVTKQLGHANSKITLQTYTHMVDNKAEKTVPLVDCIYNTQK